MKNLITNYIMSWRITGGRYPIWAGEVVLLAILHVALILTFFLLILGAKVMFDATF